MHPLRTVTSVTDYSSVYSLRGDLLLYDPRVRLLSIALLMTSYFTENQVVNKSRE
jgi:hypothetical protein